MKKLKNKKALIIAGASVVILAVAGTVAYYSDSMFLRNLFHLGGDVVEFTETFVTPDNWTPCTETPKTAIATNKNTTPRYVRMKIDEYWRTANSGTPESDHTTTDLPLTWTEDGVEERYAIINTQNEDKWTLRDDGWYYYNVALNQDESTLSFLKSVTFNCKVNTSGEIQYGADGKTGISNPNEYGGAKYHLYITFQMSDESWPNPEGEPHIADCDSNILYDTIACKTNGPDTNINFAQAAFTGNNSGGINNGLGVNTRANTADDNYPVYYYRGSVQDGRVIWRGYCWVVVRTTGTGGVKLMYSGVPTNGQCPDVTGDNVIEYNGQTSFYYSKESSASSPADAGYKRGVLRNIIQFNPESKFFIFANDVTRNGNTYTLSSDSISGTWSQKRAQAAIKYHYFCTNRERTCNNTQIRYITHFGNNYYPQTISLDGYDNIDDLMAAMKENTTDSNAKSIVDAWFETTGLSSHEDELEDTIYCNDRRISSGALAGKDVDATDGSGYTDALMRNRFSDPHPSLDCEKEDSFTKADTTNGNGALKYKIGMISSDELTFSGMPHGGDGWSSLLQSNYKYWTMTPGQIATSTSIMYQTYEGGVHGQRNTNYAAFAIRPVVSLKKGTRYVEGGDGTRTNPWVIQQ